MTKTQAKRVHAEIRALQVDRKATLAGRFLHWGIPVCGGPGSASHKPDPVCEGCIGRSICLDGAARLAREIEALQAQIGPPARPLQATLF